MQEIVKAAFLGMLGVMIAMQFKQSRPEYGTLIVLVLGILIFGLALRQIGAVLTQIERINGYLGDSGKYLVILLKVICITYVCDFAAGICKDSGYSAISGQIELLGKISVLISGLPILFAVIDQIYSFL